MGEEARAAWSEVDVVLLVSEVSRLKPPPKPAKAAPEPAPPPPLGRRGKPARIVAQPVAVEPKEELEIDVSLDPGDRFIIDQLAKAKQPVVLVLNKIDLVKDKQRLLPLIAEWTKRRPFAAIVPMSAERGVGLDQLLRELRAALPPGPKLFPEDMLTDSPERALVSERIREQIFIACYKEVPYSTAVTVDKWEERTAEGGRKRGQRRAAVIHATIHVEKPNQKGILIGEGGGTLRAIGSLARQEIQQLLGCPVFLELFVRVDEEWTHSPSGLRDMGYNAPTSGGA
jgi:GTP-binding protein Era